MRKLLIFSISAYLMAGIVSCKGVDSATPVTEDSLALNAVNAPADNTVNIKTFDKVKNAFGDGLSQSAEGTFTFPADVTTVKTIKMFIKNECPNKTCDEWDRYANVYVKIKQQVSGTK